MNELGGRGRRRRRLLVVAVVVTLAAVPVASAITHTYWWQANLGANTAATDGVKHNHYYNEMFFGNGATYPSGIWEQTACCGKKWQLNGNGNIRLEHANTWYAHPFCWNRDSTAHFVNYCVSNY